MDNEEKKPDLQGSPSGDEGEETPRAGIESGLTDREIVNEVRSAFLAYSMSVITARAIPDVRDGLKPVQRRVIYGMQLMGMTPGKPYKKSAKVVGDVMGRFHPHGDSAIYMTLVRLAQEFSLRYPLVDGHGNFGSIDGDEAAAMRYTEARMARLAVEMVDGLDEDTVDWADNYDGTEKEPTVLPSRFPNLIVNGSEGIAVGMATNMPSHNLSETIDAICALAKDPGLDVLDIMARYLHGPDFPTGGVILGRGGIRDYFQTGVGTVSIRSRYRIEELSGGRSRIIVTEIPYQVNKATMVEGIAQLVRDKVVDGISDLRDESNKEGIRVVIDVKHGFVPEVVCNNLLKHSQLQVNFGVINLCLVNGEPKTLGMKEMLQNYIDFQIEVLTRRTRFRLNRDLRRSHILEGLILAHDNIDEVIALIRSSQSDEESTAKLKARFSLSDEQCQAILAMTLRRLQGLEQGKLHQELDELARSIAEYRRLLSDQANIIDLMIEELLEIKRKYGDRRLTEISDEAASIDSEALIPEKEIVIILTKNGYVKRMDDDTFRTQNRGGRGVTGIRMVAGDVANIVIHARTHTDLLFFSSFGKVYRIRGYMLPDGARDSKGIPAVNLLRLDEGEQVVSIVPCDDYPEGEYLLFCTRNGLAKRTPLSEFSNINVNGKRALVLREGDSLLGVKRTDGTAIISIASSSGRVCSFREEEIRPMSRGASGVRGIRLEGEEEAIDLTTSLEGDKILVLTTRGFGKISYAKDTTVTDEDGNAHHYDGYRLTSRGSKGVLSLKMSAKNGELAAMRAVQGDEDLMVITTSGIVIRTPLDQVKVCGRNTQGVIIIRLEGRQKVASIAILPHQEKPLEEEGEEIEDEVNPSLAPEEETSEALAHNPTPDEVE